MKILWSKKGKIKLLRTENMCSLKHKFEDGCCVHSKDSDCHIEDVKI